MVLGIVLGGIILLVGLIFVFSAFSDYFDDARSDVADKQDQQKNDVKPEPNQQVCDLLLTVSGDSENVAFSGPVVGAEFNYRISGSTISYIWKSCHGTNTFSLASILPGLYYDPDKLSFFAISEEHDIELTFKSTDSSEVRGPDLDPSLKKSIKYPDGFVSTPFVWSKTFLVEDLPREKYDVEIHVVGQSINGRAVNFPYLYNVLP